MTPLRTRRAVGASLALALVLATAAVGTARPAAAVGSSDPGAVTTTKQVSRVHLQPDGTELVADKRTVTLKVSQTRGLHSRQPIEVTWSGAEPSGDLATDVSSPEARLQEHPFMLVECRGVDSSTAAASARLTPETCWTGTTRERDVQNTTTGFGPWRVDRYETPANRTQFAGIPDPYPSACTPSYAKSARWLHFRSVQGVDYGADVANCPAAPPESVTNYQSSQPPNTVYASTRPDGTGGATFTSWTSEDNASLGCGPTVPCALVAIPIEGISCDVAASDLPEADRPPAAQQAAIEKSCESTGPADTVGKPRSGGTEDLAVSGSLWFSESNWRNRITVPLDFAPLANVCDAAGHKASIEIYGSEALTQLMSQWRPSFCLNASRTPFVHVQIGEPQAANLLTTKNIDAAFISDPPSSGFSTPTVMAPVALSGFAISYDIDDDKGERVTTLRLDARLIAKLLTESYPGLPSVAQTDPALAHNPLDMAQDPEFIALNPGIPKDVGDSTAAASLINLSSDSDVVTALTSYLAADPDAKEWLDGVADPWGMEVNRNYTTNPRHVGHLTLPVSNWPLRDTFELPTEATKNSNRCLFDSPVPILPLISSPTTRLANIALALQYSNTIAPVYCQDGPDGTSLGEKLVPTGHQQTGFRFIIGLSTLGDAARYGLATAALQTHVAADAAETPTDAKGRTFVTPSAASLQAAAKLLTPDPSTGTWKLPYDEVVGDAAVHGAYPGAMLFSLAAPTKGLDAATAKGISQLMTFAGGPGQVAGLDVGQVPPGYLPMTAANGLGAQRAFTVRAAAVVQAQHGATVPLLPAAAATATPTPVTSAVGTAPVAPLTPTDPTSAPSTPAADSPVVASPTATPVLSSVAAVGTTPASSPGVASDLFPLLIVTGAIGAIATLVARRVASSGPAAR